MGMRQAQGRFLEASSAMDNIDAERDNGKDVLVPLTSSLYVPGKLTKLNENLVDVGTVSVRGGQANIVSKKTTPTMTMSTAAALALCYSEEVHQTTHTDENSPTICCTLHPPPPPSPPSPLQLLLPPAMAISGLLRPEGSCQDQGVLEAQGGRPHGDLQQDAGAGELQGQAKADGGPGHAAEVHAGDGSGGTVIVAAAE